MSEINYKELPFYIKFTFKLLMLLLLGVLLIYGQGIIVPFCKPAVLRQYNHPDGRVILPQEIHRIIRGSVICYNYFVVAVNRSHYRWEELLQVAAAIPVQYYYGYFGFQCFLFIAKNNRSFKNFGYLQLIGLLVDRCQLLTHSNVTLMGLYRLNL